MRECRDAEMQGCGDAGMQAANHLVLRGAGSEAVPGFLFREAVGFARGFGNRLPPLVPLRPPPVPPRLPSVEQGALCRGRAGLPGTGRVGRGRCGGGTGSPIGTEGWARRLSPLFPPLQRPLGEAGLPLAPSSFSPPAPILNQGCCDKPPASVLHRGCSILPWHGTYPPGEGGVPCLCSPAFPQRLFSSHGSH